jgi:hypothetical protein
LTVRQELVVIRLNSFGVTIIPQDKGVEAMNQSIQTKRGKRGHKKNLFNAKFWLVLAGMVALTIAVVYWSRAFTLQTERYAFIAQQMFNVFILTAVVVQALIYQGQLNAMTVAINPRLRIASVETTPFEVGRTPVFIVTLVNEGATDAASVAMYLKAETDISTGTHWHEQQIVTIPAHGMREYFIRWLGPLENALMKEIGDGHRTMKVTGYYESAKGQRVEFCYKFWPWPFAEPRPDRLPQFIPCDLGTTQNFFLTVGEGAFNVYGNDAALTKISTPERDKG